MEHFCLAPLYIAENYITVFQIQPKLVVEVIGHASYYYFFLRNFHLGLLNLLICTFQKDLQSQQVHLEYFTQPESFFSIKPLCFAENKNEVLHICQIVTL